MKMLSFSNAGREGSNQYRVLICGEHETKLIAVADGMGGKEAGDVASEIAINTLKSEYDAKHQIVLKQAFQKVKENLVSYSLDNGIDQMGTTLTACLLIDGVGYVAHVGDTRLYHLRNKGILGITKDQSELQQLIDDGVLSKKRALKYHRKNVLLSALTNYSDYELFETQFTTQKNDRLVLLSDGVYKVVSKADIRDVSVKSESLESFVQATELLIQSRTITDDYSLVAYEA